MPMIESGHDASQVNISYNTVGSVCTITERIRTCF